MTVGCIGYLGYVLRLLYIGVYISLVGQLLVDKW